MTPESLLLKRIEEELIVISESQHAQARQSCSRASCRRWQLGAAGARGAARLLRYRDHLPSPAVRQIARLRRRGSARPWRAASILSSRSPAR